MANQSKLKILIADDHAMVRAGLKQVLADDFPEAEFGEADTTQNTIERVQSSSWDVLLLDIFMPGRGGFDVLQEVNANHPSLPVLVISSAPEEQLAIRALRAGAAGYVNKQTAPEELVTAVKKVVSGGRHLSDSVAEQLVDHAFRRSEMPHHSLSDREFEVFRLLVSGKSAKEIAAQLCLSPKTISTFRTRILAKLHLQNDVQLVHYSMQYRVFEQEPWDSEGD